MALTFYTVQLNKKGFPVKYICPAADSSELTHELPQTFAPRSFSDPGEACNEFEASIGTAPRCYLEQSNFKKKARALRRMKRVIDHNTNGHASNCGCEWCIRNDRATMPQPELHKLDTPQTCSFNVFPGQQCPEDAQWGIDDQPICKSHMLGMSYMNSDNEAFLAVALEGLHDV